MSLPSRWPLPTDGIRFVTPSFIQAELAAHAMAKDCYPLALGYYPKAKGHSMQRIEHDDHLLIYCVEGSGFLYCDAYEGVIRAGDIVILPKGMGHHYRSDSKYPWSIYWIHFDGELSNVFVDAIQFLSFSVVAEVGHSAALIASFKALLGARKTGYNTNIIIFAANQLRQLLTLVPVEIQAQKNRHEHGLNVDRIQARMWESIDQHLQLDELAALANLSKYHFSARYKQITGYSPIKHFMHMKMEHACYLLDSLNVSIGEVADKLGYDDALYFSRVFKKIIGLSPKEYRESH